MKSIQNQYRDLKEGRMSEANFMRNLRMSMPQYITNTTSFGDAVKILKNKSILSESYKGNDEWLDTFKNILFNRYDINYIGTNPHKIISKYGNVSPEEAAKKFLQDPEADYDFEGSNNEHNSIGENFDEAVVLSKKEFEPEEETTEDEFDALLKQIEDEKYGEIATKSDVLDEPLEEEEQLNEGKGKDLHPNQIHPGELRMGIRVEMEHTDDPKKAEKIALDHLAENPFYYTALKLSGIESPSAPKVKAPKETKTKKAKETIQLVDLVNGMKKVKMPKADEKKKLKENVDEKMRFQDLPADPEKYKTVKDMKGKIMKATNAEGVEFQRGDVVKAYDGEEIKIADFKEEQGKIKALYNTGMFFKSIDIDGLEAPKQTMRPGVNIGGSFEKMKKSLEEIVREVMAETIDGRDNLIDPIAAEEENK